MSNTKPTNPKDAIGTKKARWFSFLPLQALIGPGLAMMEGALKYGKHNYRPYGVRASVYVDAAVSGHLTPWMEGQDIDPDSGLNHVDKAIASLLIMRDGMLQGNINDDRPPRAERLSQLMKDANERALELIERYGHLGIEPYTQKRLDEEMPDPSVFEPVEVVRGFAAEDRRGPVADRRLNKTFDASAPRRRSAKYQAPMQPSWGRRIGDPTAYGLTIAAPDVIMRS